MTDEKPDDPEEPTVIEFKIPLVPLPQGSSPPEWLAQMIGWASPSCKERGEHCSCWPNGEDGTLCCKCSVIKGAEDRPPLGACMDLKMRRTHHSHIVTVDEVVVYECPGYNPPPNPLGETLSCSVCGGAAAYRKVGDRLLLRHIDGDGRKMTMPDEHEVKL